MAKVTHLLDKKSLVFQKEVEATGGSDGAKLQSTPLPLDWIFTGVAVHHPYSANEQANLLDVVRLSSMLQTIAQNI